MEMYYIQPFNRNPIKDNKRNVIRVFGKGKVSVKPNKAEITLGVATENKQLEEAQKANAATISMITESLNTLGIPKEHIQTSAYTVFPQYDYEEGKQIFREYKVEHLLNIKTDRIESAGLVVDSAVNNGANIVSGITFSLGNSSLYEKQALSLAVIDSFKKAEAIAKTLGVQLMSNPVYVAEGTQPQGEPFPMQGVSFVKSAVSTPIQTGSMDIVSNVTAEYLFLP